MLKEKQNNILVPFCLKSRKMSTPEILESSFVLQWHGKLANRRGRSGVAHDRSPQRAKT
jgi:hypothetical protein